MSVFPRVRVPKILLIGFEPFANDPTNPSWEAVRLLEGETIAGHRVITRCLPVTFSGCLPALSKALQATRPALVICVGLAGGRARISQERVAINVCDARIADNAGEQPFDLPVVEGAPAAYFSTLPIKAMHAALLEAGFPSEISQTAGTYVCNQAFYGLQHLLRRRKARGGFIHVPYSPELAGPGAPALATARVADALRLCLQVAVRTTADAHVAGGAEH